MYKKIPFEFKKSPYLPIEPEESCYTNTPGLLNQDKHTGVTRVAFRSFSGCPDAKIYSGCDFNELWDCIIDNVVCRIALKGLSLKLNVYLNNKNDLSIHQLDI